MEFILLKIFGSVIAVQVERTILNDEFIVSGENDDKFYIMTVILGNKFYCLNDAYKNNKVDVIISENSKGSGIIIENKDTRARGYEVDGVGSVDILVNETLKSPLLVKINNDEDLDSLKLYLELKLTEGDI